MKPRCCKTFLIASCLLALTASGALAQGAETRQQGSLQVDGKDDLVSTDLRIDQGAAGSPITMEAWVFPTATPRARHHVITTDNSGYDWSILAEGDQWFVYTNRASKPTGFDVDLNRWQHLVAVFADDGVVFYKDGKPSERFPIGYDSDTAPVSIGGNVKYQKQHFTGLIDEVRVWNRALSQSEILRAMKGKLPDSEPGLAAHWGLDGEKKNMVADSSGNHHPGRLEHGAAIVTFDHAPVAPAAPVSGPGGSNSGKDQAPKQTYLVVDGKQGLVSTGLRINQGAPGSPVTMEAWVFPTATPRARHHVITTDNSGYDWSILAEGDQWFVYTNRASKPTGFDVDLNRWQHLAAVFADDGVVFYKDGKPSERFPIGYDGDNDPVSIGGNAKYRQYFTGRIDEVRVWDRALSAADIRANMGQQVATGTAGLLGYWRINGAPGGRVEDASGNSNHGRLGVGAKIDKTR